MYAYRTTKEKGEKNQRSSKEIQCLFRGQRSDVIQRVDEAYFFVPNPTVHKLQKSDLQEQNTEFGIPVGFMNANRIIVRNLGDSTILNLAFGSGVLLIKRDDGKYIVRSATLNGNTIGEMQMQPDAEHEHTIAVASEQIVDKIVTPGVSSCTFAVISDADESFIIAFHLDSIGQCQQLFMDAERFTKKKPAKIFVSMVDEGQDARETQRIRGIIATYRITDVTILDRGNSCLEVDANKHDLIGFDTGDSTVFGEMGHEQQGEDRSTLATTLRQQFYDEWEQGGEQAMEHTLTALHINRASIDILKQRMMELGYRYHFIEEQNFLINLIAPYPKELLEEDKDLYGIDNLIRYGAKGCRVKEANHAEFKQAFDAAYSMIKRKIKFKIPAFA